MASRPASSRPAGRSMATRSSSRTRRCAARRRTGHHDLYHRLDADALVVEVNVGPWVISLLRGVEQTRGLPPARVVNVRPGRGEGKAIRLEPVAGLYELGQIKHVGHFPLLEDQLVSWDPRQRWSPDRIDALVHAVAWLEPWRNRAPAESGIASLRDATLDFR